MSGKLNSLPEDFYKEAASLYIQKQGEDLLSELYTNNQPLPFIDSNRLSQKIKAKQRSTSLKKITAALVPAAACIVLLITYFTMPVDNALRPDLQAPMNNEQSADSQYAAEENAPGTGLEYAPSVPANPVVSSVTAAAEFVSARLPMGFNLAETELDRGQMVCLIESENNEIILVMEEWQDIDHARPMTHINVNDTLMYALRMNDYSLLTYRNGDLRFTLTSPFDHRDLIIIGGLLV